MIKKPSLDDWLKKQEAFYKEHVKYHPANAFCGTAGPEEMRHIEELISKLSDEQLQQLVSKAGIDFPGASFNRDTYSAAIDEIDREDFYRLYRLITKR